MDATTPGRIALFGDVGGHAKPLAAELRALGCDPATGYIPDDLTVIQLGDLVHRGPDSTGCLHMADRFMAESPGRWRQILGNHEGHEIGGPRIGGYEHALDAEGRRILRRWWNDGTAVLGAGFDTVEHGPMLAVHGGLTRTFWSTIGAPLRPDLAARLLNRMVGAAPELAFQPGVMLRSHTDRPYANPGVAWAEAATELYLSWFGAAGPPPFGQVHGHSSAYRWRDGCWQKWTPEIVAAANVRLDRKVRQLQTNIGGRAFIGIDPGHGQYPTTSWGPLLLHGTVS
jgi:hypothetical protein